MKSPNSPPSDPDQPPKPRTRPAPGAKRPPRPKKPPSIPPILLEGDYTPSTAPSGPGQRYAVGQGPSAKAAEPEEAAELPESYGTGRLFLTARDPHWLYAQWDFTRDQLKNFNRLSVDRHLILRIHTGAVGPKAFLEVHLHPESRTWFVHVGRGETKYIGELGYYDKRRKWTSLAVSSATVTPPDDLSEESAARFVTIPIDVPFQRILQLVKRSVHAVKPLLEAVQELRAKEFKDLPVPTESQPAPWSPQQESALAKLLSVDKLRRVWIGSLEITELVRRQLEAELSSAAAAQFSVPGSAGVSSFSQALPPGAEEEKFWFKVNAELIVYGATEKDARVSIGGREIKLRPDGTFSYRFSLPDGDYGLPVTAVSATGADSRSALLNFSRSTSHQGEVGAHPHDPKLKPPRADNLS